MSAFGDGVTMRTWRLLVGRNRPSPVLGAELHHLLVCRQREVEPLRRWLPPRVLAFGVEGHDLVAKRRTRDLRDVERPLAHHLWLRPDAGHLDAGPGTC